MTRPSEATPNPSFATGANGRESPSSGLPISANTRPRGSFRSIFGRFNHFPDRLPLAHRGESRSIFPLEQQEGQMAKGTGRKAGGGLARPVTPSADLAAIVGSSPLPRSEVVSKVWDHIRKNNLQNPNNKREILADDKLRKVFGEDKCTMFEMNKHLSKHLS